MSDLKAQFPHEIDLGKKSLMGPGMAEPSKPDKNKKYYPTLYLSDIPGLEGLPEDGEALIYFHRQGLTIRKPSGDSIAKEGGKKQSVSVDLEIRRICLQDDGEEDGEKETGDVIDELAEKAGVDTGKKKAKAYAGKETDEEEAAEEKA